MKVSVIVACCEKELKGGQSRLPLLKHNLTALVNQTHKDFEGLICCDGHSEPVQRTVESFNDPRLQYHYVPHRGIYGAGPQRNEMMKVATGGVLAFIDDDDFYVPRALEMIARKAVDNPGCPLVFCMQYRNGRILWTHDAKSTGSNGLLKKGHIGTPMFIVPNIPEKLGVWGPKNYSDGEFVESTVAKGWPDAVWDKRVIAKVRMQGDRKPW